MTQHQGRAAGGPFTVASLAARLGGDVEGDGARLLRDVRGLAEAGPEHLSFLSNRRYVATMRDSAAGAVLIDRRSVVPEGRTVIRCDDPYGAFARALALFHPQPWPAPGISPQAAVQPGAQVDATATIEAFVWIGPGAQIGPRTWIEAGVRVGAGARIGADCRLMASAVVCEDSVVGDRVWLNPGVVVGSEGFGFAPTAQGNIKIPQIGQAVIEDDVELGANTCVDRGAMSQTVVGRGTKTDNLVQVGHGATIGRHGLMVAYAGVAGSSTLGERVTLAARASVMGHIEVGDGAQVGMCASVVSSQPAGARISGVPAIDHRRWLRASTAFRQLPELLKTVRRLEARVAELEARPAPAAGPQDIQGILALLPHRYPALMIDAITLLEPGVRAEGRKSVTHNEPHFQGHFPGQPIMPGVLITEAFVQLSTAVMLAAHPELADAPISLQGVDRIRFRRPVTPGDTLQLRCERVHEQDGLWTFSAEALVAGQRVATGKVMLRAKPPA